MRLIARLRRFGVGGGDGGDQRDVLDHLLFGRGELAAEFFGIHHGAAIRVSERPHLIDLAVHHGLTRLGKRSELLQGCPDLLLFLRRQALHAAQMIEFPGLLLRRQFLVIAEALFDLCAARGVESAQSFVALLRRHLEELGEVLSRSGIVGGFGIRFLRRRWRALGTRGRWLRRRPADVLG